MIPSPLISLSPLIFNPLIKSKQFLFMFIYKNEVLKSIIIFTSSPLVYFSPGKSFFFFYASHLLMSRVQIRFFLFPQGEGKGKLLLQTGDEIFLSFISFPLFSHLNCVGQKFTSFSFFFFLSLSNSFAFERPGKMPSLFLLLVFSPFFPSYKLNG